MPTPVSVVSLIAFPENMVVKMGAYSDFHRKNIERYVRARNPDFDVQTVDMEAIWDSSLTIDENYERIKGYLSDTGIQRHEYTSRDYKELEELAGEWYENETGYSAGEQEKYYYQPRVEPKTKAKTASIFSFAPKIEAKIEPIEYKPTLVKTDPKPQMEYMRSKTELELEIEQLKRENHRLICGLIEIKLEHIEYGLDGLRRYFEMI